MTFLQIGSFVIAGIVGVYMFYGSRKGKAGKREEGWGRVNGIDFKRYIQRTVKKI